MLSIRPCINIHHTGLTWRRELRLYDMNVFQQSQSTKGKIVDTGYSRGAWRVRQEKTGLLTLSVVKYSITNLSLDKAIVICLTLVTKCLNKGHKKEILYCTIVKVK